MNCPAGTIRSNSNNLFLSLSAKIGELKDIAHVLETELTELRKELERYEVFASVTKDLFHEKECKYAKTFINVNYRKKYSSRQEAIEKNCGQRKICCA